VWECSIFVGISFFFTKYFKNKLCYLKRFFLVVQATTSTPKKIPTNYFSCGIDP
jgi:hypothetical protein